MTDGEPSTTIESFPLFVMNPGIITMTPQTLGTSEISKLHEQNDGEVIKKCFYSVTETILFNCSAHRTEAYKCI